MTHSNYLLRVGHGFHIRRYGFGTDDQGDSQFNMGGIYDPFNDIHGLPFIGDERQVGDLGMVSIVTWQPNMAQDWLLWNLLGIAL